MDASAKSTILLQQSKRQGQLPVGPVPLPRSPTAAAPTQAAVPDVTHQLSPRNLSMHHATSM